MLASYTSRKISITISVLEYNLNINHFVEQIGNEREYFEKLLSKDIESMIEILNIDHKYVSDEVAVCLEQDIEERNIFKYNNIHKRLILISILRKFRSGKGGNSYFIKVIRCLISNEFNIATLTVPTSMTAFNINGFGIHRLLQLPAQRGNTTTVNYLAIESNKWARFIYRSK